jgi:hypothetical protein
MKTIWKVNFMKQETIPLTYKHAILFFIAGVVWSWVIL